VHRNQKAGLAPAKPEAGGVIGSQKRIAGAKGNSAAVRSNGSLNTGIPRRWKSSLKPAPANAPAITISIQ